MINRLAWIDALRGIAIFSVLIAHSSSHSSAWIGAFPGSLQALTWYTSRGVQLFYLISAFTLFLSLNSRKKVEKRPLLNFFLRRFFRIAPLYYCAIAFYLLRDGLGPRHWLGDAPSITISNIIANITFTHGWNPYWINSIVEGGWSIGVEMPFYLLVPYLFKRIKSLDKAIWVTFITLVGSGILNFILQKHPLIADSSLWDSFLFFWLPNQLPIFCLGFVLYFYIQSPVINEETDTPSSQRQRFQRSILLLLISIFLYWVLAQGTSNKLLADHFLFSIAFVLLALSLAMHPFSFIVNRFWCYLGQISYSMYLTHLAVRSVVDEWLQKVFAFLPFHLPTIFESLVFFASLLAGTVAVSCLTYRFIELPGQALGRSLISTLESKATKTAVN